MKTWIASICLALILVISFVFIKPLTYSSKNKVTIAMTGQSTMKLWFKHWNWPYPLRIKTTYRNWPIKYDNYSKGSVFLTYHELSSPKVKSGETQFGKAMLDDFKKVLDADKPDAAFFKFCFVDFKVKAENSKSRFTDLVQIVQSAYRESEKRGIKLIVGNALPMTNSNDETVDLQKKYNRWLADFAANKNDVVVYDLFNPIIDGTGRLKPEYERGGGDPHLNDHAYSELDKTFFSQAESWFNLNNKD